MISNEKDFYVVGYSERWHRWQVRRSPASDPTNYLLAEDLGPSLKAAYLEADGDFRYLPGRDHISLITEGMPWLFVITTDGRLLVKRVGEPAEAWTLLDTGVEQAAACRGWKSNLFNVDAGLIILYRKAVGVYLRTYKEVSGEYTWTEIEQVANTACTKVDVKRLNDFRIGVYLDNPDRILITPRYYIGGTAKTEFVEVSVNNEFRVVSFCQEDGEKDPFEVTSVELHSTTEIWVTGNYPFYSYDTRWVEDVVYSGSIAGQSVTSWKVESGILKIRLAQPVLSEYTYLKFTVRRANRIRFERTPQSRPIVPELTITYEPPPVPVRESLAVAYTTSLQLSARPVTILEGNAVESVAVNVATSMNSPFKPVTLLNNSLEESMSVSVSTSLVFHLTLSGDIPV